MGEKKESKRSEKKIGNESAKKKNKSKFWLMRMRESKILYNLQQTLVQI